MLWRAPYSPDFSPSSSTRRIIWVYFDGNVFSALAKLEGALTANDTVRLSRSVGSSSVTIFENSPLLEESTATMSQSREMYRRHMDTVLNVIDRRRLIKSSEDILNEDCYNYVVGLLENDPLSASSSRVV